tara:strand:- start:70 stop:804 length:735 start_codon:yes stop_codon:yes gene_type:complete
MTKGRFVVVDGLDGIGKGVILRALKEAARTQGKKVFDVHEFWWGHDYHPDPQSIIGEYDVVVTSEPTFVGVGKYIREELIAKNQRDYSSEIIAEAYALDRWILYRKLILPLLEAGVDVFQSRSFSSSIVYQRQSAMDAGNKFDVDDIMELPGNAFCAEHPMDFLIVPTIKDAEDAMKRSQEREKDDNCVFENIDFQLKIKEHYESDEFRELFENLGTEVVYLDAGKTVEFSQQQAKEFYEKKLK